MSKQIEKKSSFATVLLVAGIVLGVTVTPAVVGQPVRATTASTADATLVVDADGGGDYQSIQAAVDEATAGDAVEVRPGTYEEEVVVDETITLVAPEGATLDGSALGDEPTAITIPAGSDAEPVVDGFTVTNYEDAFVADETTGDWTLRNVTIEDNDNDGVAAGETTGAWTVEDSVVRRNGDEGIDAENTAGDWTVRNVTIRASEDDGMDVDGANATGAWTVEDSVIRQSGDDGMDVDGAPGDWTVRGTTVSEARTGIQAINASGDWTVEESVIRNNSQIGVNGLQADGDWAITGSNFRYNGLAAVNAPGTDGDWTIRNVTVRNSSIGVQAQATSGRWTISNTSIADLTIPEFYLNGQGTGVFAYETTGAWEIRDSSITGAPTHALNATGATTEGDATRNWWGSENGPSDGDCVGNADCGDALSEPPAVAEPPKAAFAPERVTAEPQDDSESSIPGFGVAAAVLAILVGGFLLVGRRRSG